MEHLPARLDPHAVARGRLSQGSAVPHLTSESVRALADAAGRAGKGKCGERDRLMILALFDGALRVSECLALRPCDIRQDGHGWHLEVIGKGKKWRQVAVSPSMVALLQSYAYRLGLGHQAPIFPITPTRAWQITDRAFRSIGLPKPAGVGTVHVLRHSGAIERMRRTDPRSVQDLLGHVSPAMTLRYLRTLTAEEALAIQETIDFRW